MFVLSLLIASRCKLKQEQKRVEVLKFKSYLKGGKVIGLEVQRRIGST